jgi:hypothetical protein
VFKARYWLPSLVRTGFIGPLDIRGPTRRSGGQCGDIRGAPDVDSTPPDSVNRSAEFGEVYVIPPIFSGMFAHYTHDTGAAHCSSVPEMMCDQALTGFRVVLVSDHFLPVSHRQFEKALDQKEGVPRG